MSLARGSVLQRQVIFRTVKRLEVVSVLPMMGATFGGIGGLYCLHPIWNVSLTARVSCGVEAYKSGQGFLVLRGFPMQRFWIQYLCCIKRETCKANGITLACGDLRCGDERPYREIGRRTMVWIREVHSQSANLHGGADDLIHSEVR